jgi:hypothetical protein
MAKFLDYYTVIFKHQSGDVDLYEAYCSTDDVWVATKCVDALTTINAPTVYPINIDFADFGWFYAFTYVEISSETLGVYCYTRDPDIASGLTCLTALPSDACPTFVTCCNFKGQPIIGGIISTDASWTQLGSAAVCWGAIGQWEFRPAQNKTAGYIKMPWSDWDEGVVHKVARLKDVVVVYGNGGRALLGPYSAKTAVGFGLKELSGPGINKGFHHAGDYAVHGFISTNNEFWVVDEGLRFKKLGYKEYIEDMMAENDAEAEGLPIIVSYDGVRKRFYISGFSSSYVLTEFGLYSCHQSVTTAGSYRGNVLAGFVKDHEDYEARIVTDDEDFKLRGHKTIDTIEYQVRDLSGNPLYGGVDFKYNYDEVYRSSNWIRLNPQGVISPTITANDFRVKFKAVDYRASDITLGYINLRYKVVDKRAIRGLYNVGANPSRRNQSRLG